jgi:hypothetical protein
MPRTTKSTGMKKSRTLTGMLSHPDLRTNPNA